MLSTRTITNEADWHTLLMQFPQAHPLQSWAWGAFKSRWGWQASHLAFERDGAAVGAALLLQRHIPRLPFSILYTPKGPIFDYADRTLWLEITAALEQIARRDRAIFIKIDPDIIQATGESADPVPDGHAFAEMLATRGWCFSADQIQFRNTVTLELTQSEEELLAAMKQKTRYNIRLAARKGVEIRQGTPADFPAIVEMYGETAERDAFLIRPTDYYLDGWTTLYKAGLAQPFIAEYAERPLGAVIIVKFNQKAIYMYGASTERERQRMPNYLLQWESIRWAREQGCTLYDFWGAPDVFEEDDRLWGVWRFKSGFNGLVAHHIGAWDYAPRPWLYWLYTTAAPQYLAWLRGRNID